MFNSEIHLLASILNFDNHFNLNNMIQNSKLILCAENIHDVERLLFLHGVLVSLIAFAIPL